MVLSAITKAFGGRLVETYDDARSNSPMKTVEAGIWRKRAVDADKLIGVGGGNTIDIAKAITPSSKRRRRSAVACDAYNRAGEKYVPNHPMEKDPVFSVTITQSAEEVGMGFGVTGPEAGQKFLLADE